MAVCSLLGCRKRRLTDSFSRDSFEVIAVATRSLASDFERFMLLHFMFAFFIIAFKYTARRVREYRKYLYLLKILWFAETCLTFRGSLRCLTFC
jgi:hypothetical protein